MTKVSNKPTGFSARQVRTQATAAMPRSSAGQKLNSLTGSLEPVETSKGVVKVADGTRCRPLAPRLAPEV